MRSNELGCWCRTNPNPNPPSPLRSSLWPPSCSQAQDAGHVSRYWRAGRRAMGPGLVSSGLLGVLLLQYLEGRQVIWKSQRRRLQQSPCCTSRLPGLKSLLRFCLIFLEGGVLHRHVSLRDAADPAGPGSDLTWSCGWDLLLFVPKHQRPGEPGGILLSYRRDSNKKDCSWWWKIKGTKRKLKMTNIILPTSSTKDCN